MRGGREAHPATSGREDPALFLERYGPPVLIDEIQYAPRVLPHGKMAAALTKKPA